MKRLTKPGLFAYALAALVIVLDQLSKYWILKILVLPSRDSVPVIGPVRLTMVWNKGVSFGLLRADIDLTRWALAAFSIAVAIFLAVWARNVTRRIAAVALGLLIGGAIGNVIDRIARGAVVDFISLHWHRAYTFPAFNLADSAITLGAICLLLDELLRVRRG